MSTVLLSRFTVQCRLHCLYLSVCVHAFATVCVSVHCQTKRTGYEAETVRRSALL